MKKLGHQVITGILRKAGLLASIRTTRQRRSGFSVSRINTHVVGVYYYDWQDIGDSDLQLDKVLKAISDSGLTLSAKVEGKVVFNEEAVNVAKVRQAVMVIKKENNL